MRVQTPQAGKACSSLAIGLRHCFGAWKAPHWWPVGSQGACTNPCVAGRMHHESGLTRKRTSRIECETHMEGKWFVCFKLDNELPIPGLHGHIVVSLWFESIRRLNNGPAFRFKLGPQMNTPRSDLSWGVSENSTHDKNIPHQQFVTTSVTDCDDCTDCGPTVRTVGPVWQCTHSPQSATVNLSTWKITTDKQYSSKLTDSVWVMIYVPVNIVCIKSVERIWEMKCNR